MLPQAQGWAAKPCLSIFRTLLVIVYICLDLCMMGREMDFLQIDDFDIWVQVPLVLKVELSSLPCAFSVQHASDLFEKNSIVI
jgi:hypothetical protein